MTSVNLEKILKYLKIHENLRYKNLTKHCLCMKEYFHTFSSTLKNIPQAQNKTNIKLGWTW